jgi:predicted aldo/keto reductase-like oxidoreductase
MSNATRRNFLTSALTTGIGLQVASAAPTTNKKLEMPMRTLGKTGMKVTVLGFGCMTTSDPAVIQAAVDMGVNYFDTARGYQNGNNERMVGAALKDVRKKIFLVTKTPGHTAKDMMANLETSLKELGTDYVDIWHLHSREKAADIPDECFDAQDEAVKQGKVRFKGVSFHGGHSFMIPWLIEKKRTDVIMPSYNFTMAPEMDTLLEQASKAGIGVVAMKVMAGGFRSNKPGSSLYDRLKKDTALPTALKWAVRNKFVNTSIPGTTDLDQLDENFKAVSSGWKEDDSKILAAHLEKIRPLYCSMCGGCEGQCSKGLPVHDIIRYVSYAEGYGEFALGRENWKQLEDAHQAVRCGDCSECTVQCPKGVKVFDRVSRAQELFA